jgi:alpha-tubulin suppressor-like RCC1 family protein
VSGRVSKWLSLGLAALVWATFGLGGAEAAGRASQASPYKVGAVVDAGTVLVKTFSTVTGTVSPKASGAPVILERQDGKTWRKLATAKLDKAGAYVIPFLRNKPGPLKRRVSKAKGARAAGVSKTLTVKVVRTAFAVTAAPQRPAVWSFEAPSVVGAVTPAAPGRPVYLQRRAANGTWSTIATTTLTPSSTYTLTAPGGPGASAEPYRVRTAFTSSRAPGVSAPVSLARRMPMAVTAGNGSSCVLGTGDGVVCWGANSSGLLGRGTQTIREPLPGPVVGPPGGMVDLVEGDLTTCALTGAGAVWCWGSGARGEFGPDDGTGVGPDSYIPVPFPYFGKDVVAVDAGGYQTCAVFASGELRCGGVYGGDSLGPPYDPPGGGAVATGLPSGAKDVSAGTSHTCVLTPAGGVQCWGDNAHGKLGDPSMALSSFRYPRQVQGLESGVVGISAGFDSSCAVNAAGGVVCWGYNYWGQLGNGSNEESAAPVPVQGLDHGVAEVSVGAGYACALKTNNELWCWGSNLNGRLGDGTTTDTNVPRKVPVAPVTAFATGGGHMCAITTTGTVQCWGDNYMAQLGRGDYDGSGTAIGRPGPPAGLG